MRAALIFDFDGTLLPTEHFLFEKWRIFFAEHGFEVTREIWQQGIGRVGYSGEFDPWRKAEELGLGPEERLHEALRPIEDRLLAEMRPNPGVETLMAAAAGAGLPLGVASSSNTDWVSRFLDRFGWADRFASIRTRDHGPGKPSPALYRMVLEDLGACPDASWAIEDSGPGVASAKAAGLRVVAVPHDLTALHDVSAADRIVDSLEHVSLESLGLAA